MTTGDFGPDVPVSGMAAGSDAPESTTLVEQRFAELQARGWYVPPKPPEPQRSTSLEQLFSSALSRLAEQMLKSENEELRRFWEEKTGLKGD